MKKSKARVNNEIPVFFAADNNYAPFLAVAIESMLAHSSANRFYSIYILYTDISEQRLERLCALSTENSRVMPVNMKKSISDVASRLHLRDYYSAATYYRLFIAKLFPQYDKAVYLDSDIVITGNIAELYDRQLGLNLIAASREDVMTKEEIFGQYAEVVVGVPVEKYFNAGVLLMNLALFRRHCIEEKFIELLSEKEYKVTQDQDYLNDLCRGRVLYLAEKWNRTPLEVFPAQGESRILHYKLTEKPWRTEVKYGEIFWQYADKSSFAEDIHKVFESITPTDLRNDAESYNRLKLLAQKCIDSEIEKINASVSGLCDFPDIDSVIAPMPVLSK